MININKNYIRNSIIFFDKKTIDIIQQNLENCDEWIFKNYKIDEILKEFKDYKVKDKIERTVLTLKGKITFKRRRYYKINPETAKEEYIFLLDKLLGIKKWQRIDNTVKEKILSFSNIMKNAKIDKEYYINKTNKKIKVPHTLYIQIDGTYLKMWNENKKGKKK